MSYERGMQPDQMEAEARVRAPVAKRDVLGIKISKRDVGPMNYQAYYDGQEERGEYGYGSTPYMAVRNLIDAYNTTEEWERINGK